MVPADGKWNKYAKYFLKFSEKLAVKYSDVVVADNKVIQDYVLSEYGTKSELIAYGADHVNKMEISKELKEKYTFLDNKYGLYSFKFFDNDNGADCNNSNILS